MSEPEAKPVAKQPVAPAPLRSVQEWARGKNTPAWLLAAAAIGAKWECGPQVDPCMVTEAAYDAAVLRAGGTHAEVIAAEKASAKKEP